jgi:cytochrome oxidase Cu insertion factor (SCO1/SenC/PrrC family)
MSSKQLLKLVIAVTLILLFLVGCGTNPSTPVNEAATSPDTAETSDEETQPEDPPRTGDIAPDFTLPDSDGIMVNLSDELNDNRMVILVFYFAYD